MSCLAKEPKVGPKTWRPSFSCKSHCGYNDRSICSGRVDLGQHLWAACTQTQSCSRTKHNRLTRQSHNQLFLADRLATPLGRNGRMGGILSGHGFDGTIYVGSLDKKLMPSMARQGLSYGGQPLHRLGWLRNNNRPNLQREVLCAPPPPSL